MPDEQSPSERQKKIDTIRTIGALSTVGLSFVLAIVIGVAAGYYIDNHFGTGPWGFLIGFFLGLAAGVLNVVRTSRRFLK
jgi:ATP synthase protein I